MKNWRQLSNSRIADHAYVLETGNITVSGKANDVANNPRVREAYLG